VDSNKKNVSKIIYFSQAYLTFVTYLFIILILIFTQSSSFSMETILIAFLTPSLISLFFSTQIIKKSLENDLDIKNTIVKLTFAHLPTLFGLVASLILISL
jgi:hypothetical protein